MVFNYPAHVAITGMGSHLVELTENLEVAFMPLSHGGDITGFAVARNGIAVPVECVYESNAPFVEYRAKEHLGASWKFSYADGRIFASPEHVIETAFAVVMPDAWRSLRFRNLHERILSDTLSVTRFHKGLQVHTRMTLQEFANALNRAQFETRA